MSESKPELPLSSCPHASQQSASPATGETLPVRSEDLAGVVPHVLYSVAQVEALTTRNSPLGETLAWIRSFLARPHRELGRPGPVCPFVPSALVQDTIWLTVVPFGREDREAIMESVRLYRDQFRELEPKSGDLAMMKAIIIVFPKVPAEDAAIIDDVQAELKARFVECGLMIGEFHERNDGRGLRNPDFRPLRSLIPALAIRHMVESDLPFLHRSLYPPDVRADFIRSYLRRLGASLSRSNFDTALDALVTAEIELRNFHMNFEEVPVST